MGLVDPVGELLCDGGYAPDEITNALWHTYEVGEAGTATLLLAAGADPMWAGWDDVSPLTVAQRSGNAALIQLVEQAAHQQLPCGAADKASLAINSACYVADWKLAVHAGDHLEWSTG
ncbi:MAG: hypothetical protein ABI706_07155 [Ilumatobacteraceae bacterium]